MNEQPINPDVLALLEELLPAAQEAGEPLLAEQMTAEQLRQRMRDAIAVFTRGADVIPVHQVSDQVVANGGWPVPVRVYSPDEPTAVMVYMHGGAWVTGDIDTHDFVTRRLSRDTGAVVVSVDYRMLPEHPFPAPLDDTYEALRWAAELRPDLPLLVAGDSAGGTLAACAALRARDEDGPRIDAQVLVYPGVDDDLETASMLAYAEESPTSRDDLRFYFDQYASENVTLGSPYALPGRAKDLSGLPPAVVAIAGHDLLRSSEEDYAQRLREAGVQVTVQLDLGLVHGWIDFAPRVPSADRAFSRLTDTVNDLIGRSR